MISLLRTQAADTLPVAELEDSVISNNYYNVSLVASMIS